MIDRFEGIYGFLSNFHPSPIEAVGMVFPTVEHAFQAIKTEDPAERRMIAALATPGQAKRAGRKVKMRSDWNDMRRKVMYHLLKRKFANLTLREDLLLTGDQKLVEGNDWGDKYWGVCNGVGENHLGILLMKVRQYYRDNQIKEIDGNLLDITKGVIVHQVNDQRVMGSGIAKQIRDKYPQHYKDYMNRDLAVGHNVYTNISKDFAIAGLIAQRGYGRDGKQYTDYDSLRYCLKALVADYRGRDIYIPYGIGCGLGGGDWNIVRNIIDEYLPGCTLVKFKG